MIARVLFGPILLLFLFLPSAAAPRTWTDRTGKRQVEADYLTSQPQTVWLRRPDGQVVAVPLGELSKPDQEYAQERAREKAARQAARIRQDPTRVAYGPGRKLAELANTGVSESSGLACSRRQAGLFWTHNDSGDAARIYLFDRQGRDLGSSTLVKVFMYDCEDIVSFEEAGKSYLLLGDVGNNLLAANVVWLHLVEEPPVDVKHGVKVDRTPVVQTILVRYEDEAHNCEAMGLDPTSKTVLLATKERGMGSRVYALRWPKEPTNQGQIARLIATIDVPPVTAIDVSPDGRRAVVVTYGNAYEYVRAKGEAWAAAFSRDPQEIILPERTQGESICYGPDGKTLYLTSEKLPTPLWEVPVRKEPRGEPPRSGGS